MSKSLSYFTSEEAQKLTHTFIRKIWQERFAGDKAVVHIFNNMAYSAYTETSLSKLPPYDDMIKKPLYEELIDINENNSMRYFHMFGNNLKFSIIPYTHSQPRVVIKRFSNNDELKCVVEADVNIIELDTAYGAVEKCFNDNMRDLEYNSLSVVKEDFEVCNCTYEVCVYMPQPSTLVIKESDRDLCSLMLAHEPLAMNKRENKNWKKHSINVEYGKKCGIYSMVAVIPKSYDFMNLTFEERREWLKKGIGIKYDFNDLDNFYVYAKGINQLSKFVNWVVEEGGQVDQYYVYEILTL